MWLRVAVITAVALLHGCANYRAVSEFSHHTATMTDTVRGEFVQLESLCVRQAELVLVVNNLQGDGPIVQCERYRRTQGRFATLTIDVLDGYAEALGDLADNRAFDLSPEMKSVGSKVRALRDGGGDPFIAEGDAIALTRVADLLVEVMASRKRDDAVRRMAAAAPDLAVMGRALKAFFVASPDAPPNAPKPPYANFVAVVAGSTTSTQKILQSAPMRKAEPIRTAELLRELHGRQTLLERRGPGTAGTVPVRIGTAIDAWLAALTQFSTDALNPDSQELAERLRRLRGATRMAREAIAGAGQ